MPNKSNGKTPMTVYIDNKILTSFKDMVKAKYQGMTGLSIEVQTAMDRWLVAHRSLNTQQGTQRPNMLNPSPKAFAYIIMVKENLKQKYGYQPQQVTLNDLREAIGLVRGFDNRTIRKYLGIFLKFKLIKEISGNVYEVP